MVRLGVVLEHSSPEDWISNRALEYASGDGKKREYYQRIPSLKAYVLASHREPRIEIWRRNVSDWTHCCAGESAALESIGCRIDVDRVYRGILS